MISFPILTEKPDASVQSMSKENPALKSEAEGGYVSSRPRFTRKPRRTFTIGYTSLNHADYQLLTNFWDQVQGSSQKFEWTHPDTSEIIVVRFDEYWSEKYSGAGSLKTWDIRDIVLIED